jgi:putative tricarboxylic transport membrane protein
MGFENQCRKQFEKMHKIHLYAAVFWVVLGVFVSLYSWWMGLGTINSPGPGLFPFILGIIFLILAAVVLTEVLVKTGTRETEKDKKPANLLKVIAAFVVLFMYAFLVEFLGYVMVAFLALAFLLKIAGYKNIIKILGYSALTVLISYLIFTYLGVILPPGVSGFFGFI